MSLKQFITRKLKENVPLDDIKRELTGKGYSADQINKAVREAIVNAHKELSLSTKIQIGVLVAGVVLAISVAIYLTINQRGEIKEAVQTNEYQIFCKDYLTVESKITCEDAIKIALAAEPGTVKNVSLGLVPNIDFSTDPPISKDEVNWLIDIELSNSRFDPSFKKELKSLRVGVGLNEDTGIYREPIE